MSRGRFRYLNNILPPVLCDIFTNQFQNNLGGIAPLRSTMINLHPSIQKVLILILKLYLFRMNL